MILRVDNEEATMAKTVEEQLRGNLTFRALQGAEAGIAKAIAPFTAQLESLERNRGDFKVSALAKNKGIAINRAAEAADAYIKDEFEAKLVPAFQKAFGRSKPADIPVKDTGLVGIQLAQMAGMDPTGGAELILPIVERLEVDPNNQQAASHLGVLVTVLKNRLRAEPIDDGELPANEVNPVVAVIQRAEAARMDDQARQGLVGEAMLASFRSQVQDVRDQVARTGSVVDTIQAVVNGEVVERQRRPDLTPFTGVTPPEPREGADVYLTPVQASNEKIFADSTQLATDQGGRVIIQEAKP